MWRTFIASFTLSLMGANVLANPVSLSTAWTAARLHDPSFQAAISEREAGQTERALGLAPLLPQVSGSLGRTRMRGDLDTPDARGDVIRQDLHYTSKVNEVNLQQTVFDWDRFTGYRQGQAKADKALAAFDVHANDTSERLINRYFQVLLAQQQVIISKNNLDATEQHVDIARHYLDRGEGTITEVHEAQARHDIANARWLRSKDDLVIARRELQEMIGTDPEMIYGLRPEIAQASLSPESLDGWMQLALERNAQINEASQDLRVNALEIQRVFSGHLPTVALTGSLRKTEGESISTRSQESSTRSLGVSVQVPIFAGGATQAGVRQAQHNRDRSQYELEAMREEIAVEVTRQYQAVISGVEQIIALQKAVESNQLAVTAAESGYQGGVRSIIDILNVQERLYQAQLELVQARLEYVMARLMLAAVADGLNGALIDETSLLFFDDEPIAVGGV